MRKFNWINIRLVLLLIVVIGLFSYAKKHNESRLMQTTEVIFVGENNNYLKQKTVNNLLIDNFENPKNISKNSLNLNQLENQLNQHPMIEKAEVFLSVDGVLRAVVKQKTPIVRVFTDNNSFYIDYQGAKMPLSEHATARIPVVLARISLQKKDSLLTVFRTIYDDEFLKKSITGIQILDNGSMIMKNRGYDFDINFGKAINIKSKFNCYKAFLQKTEKDKTIGKYKCINLIFNQQVVATK